MKKSETILVIVALFFGILSKIDLIKSLDTSILSILYLIAINLLAFYYLLRDRKSIYTLLFGISLLAQIGSILKLMHLHFAGVLISIGLLSQIVLFLLFIGRPIIEKEKKDLNFFLITGIVVLSISQWILIFKDADIFKSIIVNIFTLILIGLLKVFSKPKNHMNQFEFDILTYTFIVLFIGALGYYI